MEERACTLLGLGIERAGGLKSASVQPTTATWAQTEHLDANEHHKRAVTSFQRKHQCSVVIEPIRQVEPAMATPPAKKACSKGRSIAAPNRKLWAAETKIVSTLATINIRVLTDEKLADIVQWMRKMSISAVALQEVAAKANNFLSLGWDPATNSTWGRVGRAKNSFL